MNPQNNESDAVQMNVINAVNANGIVTGDKVVSHIWKRLAICVMIIAAGLIAAVIVAVVLVDGVNREKNQLEQAKLESQTKLESVYAGLGVESQEQAMARIGERELLNGGDMVELDKLLHQSFGDNYALDIADQNINFVRQVAGYKYVSLGVRRSSGSVRVIMYERVADGVWVMADFDSSNNADACETSSDDEKMILGHIDLCKVEEEKE